MLDAERNKEQRLKRLPDVCEPGKLVEPGNVISMDFDPLVLTLDMQALKSIVSCSIFNQVFKTLEDY